jgi:XTP/dITP diphosphohydrolase
VSPGILLASTNAKKLRELGAALGPLGLGVLGPAELPGGASSLPSVDEDRPTFAENAAKKAASAARASGSWALADDSGLEVDALGGEPGVRSARFAGEPASDAANNRLLIERLRGVPDERRSARFVCALALARPDGSIAASIVGTARGRILSAPRGSSGFGYDPLFLFHEPGEPLAGRTFAELDAADKNRVSHRGRAVRALAEHISELLEELAADGVEDEA